MSKQQERQETTEEYVARFKAERAAEQAAEQAKIDARMAELDARIAAKKAADEHQRREAQEAQEAERAAKAQAEFDARHKAPALRAWVAQGGDAAEFERRWPEQAAKIRMAESTRQNDEARRAMAAQVRSW